MSQIGSDWRWELVTNTALVGKLTISPESLFRGDEKMIDGDVLFERAKASGNNLAGQLYTDLAFINPDAIDKEYHNFHLVFAGTLWNHNLRPWHSDRSFLHAPYIYWNEHKSRWVRSLLDLSHGSGYLREGTVGSPWRSGIRFVRLAQRDSKSDEDRGGLLQKKHKSFSFHFKDFYFEDPVMEDELYVSDETLLERIRTKCNHPSFDFNAFLESWGQMPAEVQSRLKMFELVFDGTEWHDEYGYPHIYRFSWGSVTVGWHNDALWASREHWRKESRQLSSPQEDIPHDYKSNFSHPLLLVHR